MRRKLIAGAALLALLMNSPNVSADEDVVIFGGEFEDEKPAPKVERPAPIREIPKPVNKPVDEPQPEPVNKPVDEPQPEPVNEPQPEPVNEPTELVTEPFGKPQPATEPEEISDDDEWDDILIFDEISQPQLEPVNKPTPVTEPINNPQPEPINEPEPVDEPVIEPQTVDEPVDEPKPRRRTNSRRYDTPPQNLKVLNQRFVKLAVDETYTYYLDKTSVQWKKMPYSTSEYMADFWIRMIERDPQNSDDFYGEDAASVEILSARERGYRYMPEDEAILRRQSYVLEHYYLRPKTKQIQFLCELEVFGRPQNTINERAYDYRNWEDLVPGSIEAAIYYSAVKVIHTSRANPNNHMTFWDMLDEYARISL